MKRRGYSCRWVPSVLVLMVLVGVYVAARAQAVPAQTKLPTIHYEKYKLKNGLDVILSENHSLPLVAVNIWYHVGPANERPGRTGFAHLFEHMMFEGSEHVGPKAHFKYLEAAGGTHLNATTDFDRTNYFETVPSNQLELALWLESDRMGFLLPMLDGEKLANQRDVVRNERRQTTENVPYGLVEEEIFHQLFPLGHPYHAAVIGSHADIEAASLDDVREFFREYYVPNNASLAIVGDFDTAHVKTLIEKYFGPIPAGRPVPKIDVQTRQITSEKRVTVTDQVQLPRVYISWITPPIYKPGDAESDLLAEILGRGRTSRLYEDLVYDKQIAQDVDAWNQNLMLGSVFTVRATAKPGVKPEDLEKAMDADIEKLRADGPSNEEVEKAVNTTESGMVESLETFSAQADRLNQYNQHLGDPGYLPNDFLRYEKATPMDLKRVAQEELNPEASVVVYGVPGNKVIHDVPRARTEEGKAAPTPPSTSEDSWRANPPAAGPRPKFSPPIPESFKLANGLTVLVIERHELPVVSANLVVIGGGTANPSGEPGLASFASEMLREGTRSRSALEFADDMEAMGATFNTNSDYDSTNASLRMLSKNADAGFGLLADAALNPAFDPKEIERLRSERLTSLSEEQDDPPALRNKAMYHALYGDTSYGYDLLGTVESNKSVSQEALKAFWKRTFTPSASALVISGDLTAAEARNLTQKYFGSWSGPAADNQAPVASAAPSKAIYIIDKPGAPQTSLAIGEIGARRETRDYTSLEILDLIFGGTFSSRLNMNLREVHGYTYGAHANFDFRRGDGPFMAWSGIRADVTAPALEEMYSEVDRIRSSDVTPEELRFAKGSWSESLVSDFETTADTAGTFGDLFVYGLPLDYYQGLPAKIDAVTAADVRRMASKYLNPDTLVVVAVGDRAKIEPAIEKLNIAPVKVLP